MRGKFLLDRPRVGRIVMHSSSSATSASQSPAAAAAAQRSIVFLPVQRSETREPRRPERAGSARKCAYSLLRSSTRSGRGVSRRMHGAARIAASSASGTCTVPIACSPIRRRPGAPDRIAAALRASSLSNAFCDGCGSPGRSPSSEPRCSRERFEIEHLRAFGGERGEQAALAGAREAADDAKSNAPAASRACATHVAPICAIAAFELDRAPADLVQHVRERAAALSAAPAVDERAPSRAACRRTRPSSIAAMLRATTAAPARLRGERRILRVQRADARALGVVEHRVVLARRECDRPRTRTGLRTSMRSGYT